jgi:hypothetical protein
MYAVRRAITHRKQGYVYTNKPQHLIWELIIVVAVISYCTLIPIGLTFDIVDGRVCYSEHSNNEHCNKNTPIIKNQHLAT